MNIWNCDHPGCTAEARGVGGAIGLRAIGWYFRRGPVLFCPRHRPDPVPCDDKYSEANHGAECALCAGEHEAKHWQDLIETTPT